MRTTKILWFANTPCGATNRLTGKPVMGGGWLYALSEQLKMCSDIELHIAFYWGNVQKSFKHEGIYYHPILLEGDGSKVGRLINRHRIAWGYNDTAKILPRLISVIEDVCPDIIHIHGSENNFGMIAMQKLPCPIVLSIQGLLSPYYYKLFSGFSRDEILRHEGIKDKLLANGIAVKAKSMKYRAEMERNFLSYIPNIIGRTFWDKACSLALSPKRRYYEVGEILRPEFYNAKWDKNHFGTPLTIVSTISHGVYKGLETIYHTAGVLKAAGVNFLWCVIGLTDSDTIVHLAEKQVGVNAKSLNVCLLGRKNASQMVDVMREADIYVQVSHIENSPNSLCEAMLLGMPCVATFVGGTASLVENNVEGRLVQDGDPYIMAGTIMEMADDFEAAKAMGRHATEKAIDRHSPEKVCDQLKQVYQEITAKR